MLVPGRRILRCHRSSSPSESRPRAPLCQVRPASLLRFVFESQGVPRNHPEAPQSLAEASLSRAFTHSPRLRPALYIYTNGRTRRAARHNSLLSAAPIRRGPRPSCPRLPMPPPSPSGGRLRSIVKHGGRRGRRPRAPPRRSARLRCKAAHSLKDLWPLVRGFAPRSGHPREPVRSSVGNSGCVLQDVQPVVAHGDV